MNFIDSESRKRHRFIESSIGSVDEELRNNQHLLASLGERATGLMEVSSRLFVPNMRHGEVGIPWLQRRRSGIPVLAIETGQEVRLDPRHFARFSPRQQAVATEIARAWLPCLRNPDVLADKIARHAFRGYLDTPLPQGIGVVRLGPTSLARAYYYPGVAQIGSPEVIAAGFPGQVLVKGWPTLELRYNADTTDADPPLMLHEYRHLVQHETEPLVAIATDEEKEMYTFGLELDAYNVGALGVRAMQAAGRPVHDIGWQVERDRIRAEYNGDGDFTPSPGLHGQFIAASLGVLD
jgi:hypothetical protein